MQAIYYSWFHFKFSVFYFSVLYNSLGVKPSQGSGKWNSEASCLDFFFSFIKPAARAALWMIWNKEINIIKTGGE